MNEVNHSVLFNFLRKKGMLIEKMGQNAGLVWNALNNGALSTKAVKKATKLKEAELNQAFGWLAREGKIAFNEVEGELFVSLI